MSIVLGFWLGIVVIEVTSFPALAASMDNGHLFVGSEPWSAIVTRWAGWTWCIIRPFLISAWWTAIFTIAVAKAARRAAVLTIAVAKAARRAAVLAVADDEVCFPLK